MGLRLAEGLPLERLRALTSRQPGAAILQELIAAGSLAPIGADRRLRATPDGRILLDTIVLKLSENLEHAQI